MTHIISAFPCLGKTTLYQLNKLTIFDREVNESRSIIGLSNVDTAKFYSLCKELILLQALSNHYDYIFITDNENISNPIAQELVESKHQFTYIFPNVYDTESMENYKINVVNRSGIDWYNRIIVPKLKSLKSRIDSLKNDGYDVRLTDIKRPYIEDVFQFKKGINLPPKG